MARTAQSLWSWNCGDLGSLLPEGKLELRERTLRPKAPLKTAQLFLQFVREAHRRDMHVIVFNHVGIPIWAAQKFLTQLEKERKVASGIKRRGN